MPNPRQPGYLMRKHLVEREFFPTVDERWTDIGLVQRVLEGNGYRSHRAWRDGRAALAGHGDAGGAVPPEAGHPLRQAAGALQRRLLAVEHHGLLPGPPPDLCERVMKYAWLDHSRLPWQALKSLWAHHRYVLCKVQ